MLDRVHGFPMRHHRSLDVWQRAKALVIVVYRLTSSFPNSERFVHTNQMRRCAVSISSNIEKGSAADTDAQFSRFLGSALASAAELQSQAEICAELHLGRDSDYPTLDARIEELKKMIAGLRRRLR